MQFGFVIASFFESLQNVPAWTLDGFRQSSRAARFKRKKNFLRSGVFFLTPKT